MPTFRALQCFVAVMETGSLRAAAEQLHASQPAVSHQLATLETEVGVPLFERLPRGVSPTVAGRAIFDDAVEAIAAAERVRETGRAVAAGQRGTLRIGCAASMIVSVLPPTLKRLHTRHPDVAITVLEADSADVLANRLAAGEVDVVLSPRPTDPGIDVEVIGTEEVMVVMAADHPLAASADDLPVAEIDGLDAVLYSPTHGLGGWIDAQLAFRDVELRPVLRTRQVYGAAQLAEAGLGVALVPVTAIPDGFAGAVRGFEPPLHRHIVVFTRNADDPVVSLFITAVRERGIPTRPSTG